MELQVIKPKILLLYNSSIRKKEIKKEFQKESFPTSPDSYKNDINYLPYKSVKKLKNLSLKFFVFNGWLRIVTLIYIMSTGRNYVNSGQN